MLVPYGMFKILILRLIVLNMGISRTEFDLQIYDKSLHLEPFSSDYFVLCKVKKFI